jgi:hypothetical protein
MTRYINLCYTRKKPEGPKQAPHYEQYRESYKAYEDGRKEYRQDYNEAYRELKDGSVECECGCVVKQLSIYAHRKSKRHAQILASK